MAWLLVHDGTMDTVFVDDDGNEERFTWDGEGDYEDYISFCIEELIGEDMDKEAEMNGHNPGTCPCVHNQAHADRVKRFGGCKACHDHTTFG